MQIVWKTVGHGGEPRNQQAHLFGPYWAVIGPNPDPDIASWSWAIYHQRDADEPVAMGFGYDRHDAKTAVVEWARPRAPRSWKRRLRGLSRHSR